MKACHKLQFLNGQQSVEDEPHGGRPSTSRTDDNVQRVRDVRNSYRRLSVRMIADRVGIDKMTVHTIITEDLAMRKVCAKLVPKVLTDDQKQRRVAACEDLLQRVEEDPQPPCSPDLAPADFFLFPKVKSSLKGHHHGTLSAIKEACTRTLKDLPESAYQGTFVSWQRRWQKCIDAQGMYFEEF
ncbi:protein GVQW3-like [Cryptotermes secundus]|uniref:protein GVQW3-like n=1 Tax=Cryptotermes secundus TaxID=105785 RepID=UPI000CD7B8F4|nr:protein GVQW3-like [Cryptotermes secundus]